MFGYGETVFGLGETEVCGMWVFPPGVIVCARKMIVPRTKEFNVVIIGLLLCMIGLSDNSQEMLSTL